MADVHKDASIGVLLKGGRDVGVFGKLEKRFAEQSDFEDGFGLAKCRLQDGEHAVLRLDNSVLLHY